jgi:hypothetical protein
MARSVASREDMGCRAAQIFIDLHEFALIDFDARRGEIQAACVGAHPVATTTSVAWASNRRSSFVKIIRTPVAVFSNHSSEAEAYVPQQTVGLGDLR